MLSVEHAKELLKNDVLVATYSAYCHADKAAKDISDVINTCERLGLSVPTGAPQQLELYKSIMADLSNCLEERFFIVWQDYSVLERLHCFI
jgi:hypothetical protein